MSSAPEKDVDKSVVDRIFAAIAQRLAADPRIPQDSRLAFQQTAETVMRQQFSAVFGGERVRFYIPTGRADARSERILASLGKGEEPARIAAREDVTERHVRRLRGRLIDRTPPP